MAVSTYSFGDIKAVISHPDFSSLSLYNAGVGDMTVSKTNDNTAHDTASDGSVMVSKIIVNKAEIDVFLELFCFFHDPADVGKSKRVPEKHLFLLY